VSAGEDVVLQGPEDVHFLVPIFHTNNACCGSATAYLLRRIAYRAGAYAPGIQEHMFHQLNTSRDGGSLERVQRWFGENNSTLQLLGYRLQCRRFSTPTPQILDWVKAGRGYRGIMLPTDFQTLHPEPGASGENAPENAVQHAVGVTVDRLESKGEEQLVMIDPWPGVKGGAKDRAALHPKLESASRHFNFHGLMYFWTGWS
jgi:hypothetical protein